MLDWDEVKSSARCSGFNRAISASECDTSRGSAATSRMSSRRREVALRNRPFRKPVVILSGGETTVMLGGKSNGGRNTEFLLAFAIGIGGMDGIAISNGSTRNGLPASGTAPSYGGG
jgi:glycerate-2-kinase